MMQVPIAENQLGTMQMMEEVSEHVEMNYTEIPDSSFVVQPRDLWTTQLPSKREDEGFSEPRTPVSERPVMEARPALRSIENLQNSSAARQLFDL